MTHELAAGEQRDLINKVIQKNVVFECDLHVVRTLMQRLIDGQNLREMSCIQVHARLQQVSVAEVPTKKNASRGYESGAHKKTAQIHRGACRGRQKRRLYLVTHMDFVEL
jgi:hypothetical protein